MYIKEEVVSEQDRLVLPADIPDDRAAVPEAELEVSAAVPEEIQAAAEEIVPQDQVAAVAL